MENVSYDELPLNQLSHGMHKIVNETRASRRLKSSIDRVSNKKLKVGPDTHRSNDKVEKARKSLYAMLKEMEDDPRVTDTDIDAFTNGVKKLHSERMDVVNKRHGKKGGGHGKIEMYGHEGAGPDSPLRKTAYGSLKP